jgi:tryptophan halogenase
VESPNIPKIGVGETVTPHVAAFFDELGIPSKEWMLATGSVYKFANKFINWKQNTNETEYFSFEYPTSVERLYKSIEQPSSFQDLAVTKDTPRTIDALLTLHQQGRINKFDKYFNPQFHYMERNVAPFDGNNYLLNPLYSWTQHINAELAADFIRDKIALPSGVKHIQAKVQSVWHEQDNITRIDLDSNESIRGDLFVDASGFSRVLVNKLSRAVKEYKDIAGNAAWVCQIDYNDPDTEMVNYTTTTAQKYGWSFNIGLYHRMGAGYIFSTNHTTADQAFETYTDIISKHNRRREPRLIQWTPNRLVEAGKGNVAAIGLSCGFVEPMEANALYIIINSIRKLNNVIEKQRQTKQFDFAEYNQHLGYATDDIADFVKVHYTLAEKDDSDLWNEMRWIGIKDKHKELVYSKFMDERHNMVSAWDGISMFPDYMWAQFAMSWGLVDSSWKNRPVNDTTLGLAELYFKNNEIKHDIISSTRQNNFRWLKQNIFNGMMPHEWEKTYLG